SASGRRTRIASRPCSVCSCCCDPRHLPSFPTRRSSDLEEIAARRQREMQEKLRQRLEQQRRAGQPGAQTTVRRPDTLGRPTATRSEEHTSELQSRENLVCRLLLEKKNGRAPHARSGRVH